MPCYTPLEAFRTRESHDKYSITFDSNHPNILFPIKLPCGQCIGCRIESAREWAVRCVHESELHDSNCFLTLTYDEDHFPENGSLNKIDFQLFLKRLRKRFSNIHFSYLQCGEYGENYGRPHHHACLFGFDFPDKVLWKVCQDNKLYTSEILNEIWGFGYCIIGSVTFESASYVARYVTKKITGAFADFVYQGRLPEYATMSRRPALGLNWIKRYFNDVYPNDSVVINGFESSPPRYYDKFCEKNFPDIYSTVCSNRDFTIAELSTNPDFSSRRNTDKYEVFLSRVSQLSRSFELSTEDFTCDKIKLVDKRRLLYLRNNT